MPELRTYARYYTTEDADDIIELLRENGIRYNFRHEVNQLDNIYIGESLAPMFALQLPVEQFKKVTQLLTEQADKDSQDPNFEHPFQLWEPNELKEVLQHPNDWNAYNLQIAKIILQRNADSLNKVEALLFSEKYKPESISFQWICLGYLLCLLTICGIFFGLSIIQAKKTLQDGKVVRLYDENTISHGRVMILIGSVFTILLIVIKFRAEM